MEDKIKSLKVKIFDKNCELSQLKYCLKYSHKYNDSLDKIKNIKNDIKKMNMQLNDLYNNLEYLEYQHDRLDTYNLIVLEGIRDIL